MNVPPSHGSDKPGGVAGKAGKALLYTGLAAAVKFVCEKAGHSLSPSEVTGVLTAVAAVGEKLIDEAGHLSTHVFGGQVHDLFHHDPAQPTASGLNHDIERVLARAAARTVSALMAEWKRLPPEHRAYTRDQWELDPLVEACDRFLKNETAAAVPECVTEWIKALEETHILDHAGLAAAPSTPPTPPPPPCKFSEYFHWRFPAQFKRDFAEEYASDEMARSKFNLLRDELIVTLLRGTKADTTEIKAGVTELLHRAPVHRVPFDRVHLIKPIRAGVLIGRDTPRDELAARLRRGEDACVWGPAGFGKTALAAEALRLAIGESDDELARSRFPDGIVFLDLYALKAVPERVWTQLADRFAFGRDEQLPPRERATRACANPRALVVVEGAEEAQDGAKLHELLSVLGPEMRRLVLTRNSAQDFTGRAIRLNHELKPEDAFALLEKVAEGGANEAQLREIVKLMGGHPLALTHAGCQLAQPEDSPAIFLEELRAAPLKLREPGHEDHTLRWLYDRSVRLTSEDARRVLAGLGRLAYAPFPVGAAQAVLTAGRGVPAASTPTNESTPKRPEGRAAEATVPATRARDALRQWVRHGFLTPPGDSERWQFTHALAYRYAGELPVGESETNVRLSGLLVHLASWVVTEFAASLAPFEAAGEKTTRHVRRVDDMLAHATALLAADAPPSIAVALRLLPVQDALPGPGRTVLLRPHFAVILRLLYQRLKPVLAHGPNALAAELARLSSNVSIWLSELGRRAEALAPAQEAVEIRRAQARQNPDAFLQDLANALNTLGNCLANTGKRTEALQASEEAVTICRQLASQNWDAHADFLAMALNNLGNQLSGMGRWSEALSRNQEAVKIRRDLMNRNWSVYAPKLALALDNLGASLSDVGRHRESITVTEEAVAIYRRLAAENSDAYTPSLATSIASLGVRLSDQGRWADALGPSEDAVELFRKLASMNWDAFASELAGALNNLGLRLSENGRSIDSIEVRIEAIQIYHALAEENWDAYAPGLALTLNNFGGFLKDGDSPDGALDPIQEAIRTYRKLTAKNWDAFAPDLAGALTNLGLVFNDLGRPEEARSPAQEGVEIRRKLVDRKSDQNLQHLGGALTNLGLILNNSRHATQAKQACSEAVTIYRELAAKNWTAIIPDFAMSLFVSGLTLANFDAARDALAAFSEGIRVLTPLFQACPMAHASLIARLVRAHQQLSQALNQPPDEALLAPVREVFARLQSEPPPGPAS